MQRSILRVFVSKSVYSSGSYYCHLQRFQDIVYNENFHLCVRCVVSLDNVSVKLGLQQILGTKKYCILGSQSIGKTESIVAVVEYLLP